MNAAETMQAAIDKLIERRDKATAGPWRIDGPDFHFGVSGDDWDSECTPMVTGSDDRHPVMHGANVRNCGSRVNADQVNANADLIVTLYATIDAQILALEIALRFVNVTPNVWTPVAILLARAILGDQADD